MQNVTPIVKNWRGYESINLLQTKKLITPETWIGSISSLDIKYTLDYVLSNQPNIASINVIGYSTGGCAFSYFLKSYPDYSNKINKFIICNSPIIVNKNLFSIMNNPNLLQQLMFWKISEALIENAKQHKFSYGISNNDISQIQNNYGENSIIQFHKICLAPNSGAKDLTEYWNWASPIENLKNSTVDFVIILTKDDPIISFDIIKKYINLLKCDKKNIIILENGGHCSGIEQLPNDFSSLDNVIIQNLNLCS